MNPAGPTTKWFRWPQLSDLFDGLAAAALGLLLLFTFMGEEVRRWSYDLQFAARPDFVPGGVVLVYLDEASHKVLEQPFHRPWDRALHAELVTRLHEAGARAVVFDILFTDEGARPEADREFAAAIRTNGRVVLAGELEIRPGQATLHQPYAPFRAEAAAWGLAQIEPGTDFAVREHLASVAGNPTLSWATARWLGVRLPPAADADNGRLGVNYYAPPGSLPWVSYHKALLPESVPAGFFKGQVVFVGAHQSTGFTGAKKDDFGTAYTRLTQAFAPGTEIHATMFLNLLRGDWLTRFPRGLEATLVVLAGLGFGWGLGRMGPLNAALTACGGLATVTLAAALLFRFQLVWFAWLIVVVQIVFAWVWASAAHSIRAFVTTQMLEKTLAFHLSPRRARQLRNNPELLRPHGEKMPVTFLFTDLYDFTTISGRLPPARLFEELNHYFARMVPCIHATDGTVVQFVGDAIYAIWNAPEPQPDHAVRALRAALRMRAEVAEFECEGQRFAFRTRLGLHTGVAVVGNCGSAERFEYAAIGMDTNLAARLEGLNKHLGTEILASEELLALTAGEFLVRPVGRFRPKGSERVLGVSELLAERDGTGAGPAWLAVFAAALAAFQAGDWKAAEADFQRTLQLRTGDGPSRFYLKLIASRGTPGEGWTGEVSMEEK